jgi:hypothetical protein
MKADWCVPIVVQLHYFIQWVKRCHVKNIEQSWVWLCEAIGQKPNYYLTLTFGTMRHIDVIASHLLFSPLKETKYQT